jgi:outer membrane protein OmpA-like peptidoglycan-associated protein
MTRALLLVAVLAGCASAPTNGPHPYAFQEPFGDPYDHTTGPKQIATTERVEVVVDASLAARCKLPGPAVYFEFDSADLGMWAQEQLGRIAQCVTTGPAAGVGLELVGRADPRGTDDYNYDLGMARADAVATFLSEHGLEDGRLLRVSRGEQAASPESWKWVTDRRVTLRLHADGSVAPTPVVSTRD